MIGSLWFVPHMGYSVNHPTSQAINFLLWRMEYSNASAKILYIPNYPELYLHVDPPYQELYGVCYMLGS